MLSAPWSRPSTAVILLKRIVSGKGQWLAIASDLANTYYFLRRLPLLGDQNTRPRAGVEAIDEQGCESGFVEALPARNWDIPQEFTLMNNSLMATPRKSSCTS